MATYYVDNANGNDTNAGTSEGAAWATIQKALDTVAAGDTVYVQGGTTYAEVPNIVTVGTNLLPIVIEGYTTTPGDEGQFTIDGSSTYCFTSSSTVNHYYIFKNMILENASSHGWGALGADNLIFYNCIFRNCGGYGTALDNSVTFVKCSAYGNSGRGFDGDNSQAYIFCRAYDNGSYQAWNASGFQVGCVFYGHTQSSTDVVKSSPSGHYVSAFNTFDADAWAPGSAVYGLLALDSSQPTFVIGNLFHGNGNSNVNGLESSVGYITSPGTAYGNFFSGGLGRNFDKSGNPWDVTANLIQSITGGIPDFTDEAGHDYTLGSNSDAVDRAELSPPDHV